MIQRKGCQAAHVVGGVNRIVEICQSAPKVEEKAFHKIDNIRGIALVRCVLAKHADGRQNQVQITVGSKILRRLFVVELADSSFI